MGTETKSALLTQFMAELISRIRPSASGLYIRKRIGEDLKEVCTLQREQIQMKKITQIIFGEEDLARVQPPHGALVVTLRIHDCDVQRILVDRGSSANVLFLETLKKLSLDESRIQKSSSPLIGLAWLPLLGWSR